MVALVEKHGIRYHEKTLGQPFDYGRGPVRIVWDRRTTTSATRV